MDNATVSTISDSASCDLVHERFKVYEIKKGVRTPSYRRRDFYKICLVTGKNTIHYANRKIEVDGTILFFANPNIPYSWEAVTENQKGFACLFTGDYFSLGDHGHSLQRFPFFRIEGTPLLYLNRSEEEFIQMVFRKMLSPHGSEYINRDELMRDYIKLILNEAQRIQPIDDSVNVNGASFRIASLFLELLEKQFPIESQGRRLQLRYARDFANQLAIHVNHLNYSVREVTGKSTTKHISDRIANEAKALLKNTNWSIADISYCLGFEYPTHFTNYYKRITKTTPKSVRRGI